MRIDRLGGGLYGFVSDVGDHAGLVGDNPATPWDDIDAAASCMVLNEDYTGFPSTPIASLQSTAGHEFNHSIQFGLGALAGANDPEVLAEAGATWMEDESFDTADDNYNYLWPSFATCLGHYAASPYDYWVVLRAMTERHGTGVAGGGEQILQDFWEQVSQGVEFLPALDAGFAAKGTTLEQAFHEGAVALKFNRACGGGYAYPYCLEEGPGYLAAAGDTPLVATLAGVGATQSGALANHFATHWLGLPPGSAYAIRLENQSSGGELLASAACDTGSALVVLPLGPAVGPGGSATLGLFDGSPCVAAALTITNQERTSGNPNGCAGATYQVTLEPAQAPVVLYAVKDPTRVDVDLSWSGVALQSYTVLRGTLPDALAAIGSVTGLTYSDPGAVAPPPSLYYYQVQ